MTKSYHPSREKRGKNLILDLLGYYDIKEVITDIARGEADLDTLKAGASLIPVAKITKVPKVVKAIGNVGKTGFKKGKEGEKISKSGQAKQTKAKNQGRGGASKPNQVHHFATNKSKKYTSQFENVTKKYGLDLDDNWNKELMPHQGRHPYVYHDYVLDNMKKFDRIANGDKTKFLKLFEQMKQKIIDNPDMLYKEYWRKNKK